MVEVAIAAGDTPRALEAMAELDQTPQLWSTSGLEAHVLAARAELASSRSDHDAAIAHLREAIRLWHRIGSPLHILRQRLRLAQIYVAADDRDAGQLELSAARSALADLDAPALAAEIERVARRVDAGER